MHPSGDSAVWTSGGSACPRDGRQRAPRLGSETSLGPRDADDRNRPGADAPQPADQAAEPVRAPPQQNKKRTTGQDAAVWGETPRGMGPVAWEVALRWGTERGWGSDVRGRGTASQPSRGTVVITERGRSQLHERTTFHPTFSGRHLREIFLSPRIARLTGFARNLVHRRGDRVARPGAPKPRCDPSGDPQWRPQSRPGCRRGPRTTGLSGTLA